MIKVHIGKPSGRKGKIMSEETKNKISLSKSGVPSPLRGRVRLNFRGEKNPCWISDRSKLAKRQERNDMAYKEWRRQVWLRDNFKCKIANSDCKGKIEAHHILSWKDFPDLRYEVNNGITVCHTHHPKKRVDETRLSPFFQKLLINLN